MFKGPKGLYISKKGELVPNYSLIYDKEHQNKWATYLSKWIKTWSIINKGKKSPSTVAIDSIQDTFADLVKLKLVGAFKKDSQFKTSPSFFSQFYKNSQFLYFQNSVIGDAYLSLLNCYFKAYYGEYNYKSMCTYLNKNFRIDKVQVEKTLNLNAIKTQDNQVKLLRKNSNLKSQLKNGRMLSRSEKKGSFRTSLKKNKNFPSLKQYNSLLSSESQEDLSEYLKSVRHFKHLSHYVKYTIRKQEQKNQHFNPILKGKEKAPPSRGFNILNGFHPPTDSKFHSIKDMKPSGITHEDKEPDVSKKSIQKKESNNFSYTYFEKKPKKERIPDLNNIQGALDSTEEQEQSQRPDSSRLKHPNSLVGLENLIDQNDTAILPMKGATKKMTRYPSIQSLQSSPQHRRVKLDFRFEKNTILEKTHEETPQGSNRKRFTVPNSNRMTNFSSKTNLIRKFSNLPQTKSQFRHPEQLLRL